MSLWQPGVEGKAQNTIILGRGTARLLLPSACSTWRCSSAPCSGPKLTTTRSPVSRCPLACRQVVPAALPARKLQHLPALPRMPVLSSSSRQVCWRLVLPLRATEISAKLASSACGECAECSSSDSTVGNGTASTVKGPVTRSLFLAFSGWSYRVSLLASEAIERSMAACMLWRAVRKATNNGWACALQPSGSQTAPPTPAGRRPEVAQLDLSGSAHALGHGERLVRRLCRQRGIELHQRRSNGRVHALVDRVNLGVVGNVLSVTCGTVL